MYGQKSKIRSKVFINTLYTKSIIQFHDISTILLLVCVLTFQAEAPPPLPHKMYRFKY